MSFRSLHEALKVEVRARAGRLMASDDLFMRALKRHFPDMSVPVVLGWTPEQGEEIFVVLVDRHRVATAEYPRGATDVDQVEIEIISVLDYQRQDLDKDTRRTLKAGLELQL